MKRTTNIKLSLPLIFIFFLISCGGSTGSTTQDGKPKVPGSGGSSGTGTGTEGSLFSDYSPLNDDNLLSLNHERGVFPQVTDNQLVDGLWLFVHQGTFYSRDGDTGGDIGTIAIKSIVALSLSDSGQLVSANCGNEDSLNDGLPFIDGQYTKTDTYSSDDLEEITSVTIAPNLSELTGNISYNSISTGKSLANTAFKAYKISASTDIEDVSIGTFQLNSLSIQLLNSPVDTIDSQKDFTLNCVTYIEEFIEYEKATDEQKASSYTIHKSTTDFAITGSNDSGEKIKMTLDRTGSKFYALNQIISLYLEIMVINYTDSEGETITSFPAIRQQKDGVVSSNSITADYTLGFRELIGGFNVDTSFDSKATGSVNAKF